LDHDRQLRAHLVGSIPLPDTAAVLRTVGAALGPYLERIPDGETGIRRMWIKFLQDKLAEHPAIEVADDLPAFRFCQWDGTLVREITRKRIVPGIALDPDAFDTRYAEMAIASWQEFAAAERDGTIPGGLRFQICLPTPIAPTYNNMVPGDRAKLLPALTRHFRDEVERIAATLPRERIAIQWDVCQEVLAWEGYYDPGPVDFRSETLDVLHELGDAVPEPVELGFHLCYGSPADEHLVQPRDAGVMVEMTNAIAAGIARPVDWFHMPVPRARDDDDYFAPLTALALAPATDLYLGLVHYDDGAGDRRRLAAARRHTRVDGIATECGLARGDPARLGPLLAAHAALIERES